jgi:hypothetical protein
MAFRMAFADDLTFRDLTDHEINEIAGDRRVLAVQLALAIIPKDMLKP